MPECYVKKKKTGQKPKANKVALHAHIENVLFCLSCYSVKWGQDYRTRGKDLKGNIPDTLGLDFLTLRYILKFY